MGPMSAFIRGTVGKIFLHKSSNNGLIFRVPELHTDVSGTQA